MSWTGNAIMFWNGNKITDHGRGELDMTTERIGTDKRMNNGLMRRQFIANKRTWTIAWENIPSTNSILAGYKTADGGYAGEDIESFYKTTPGPFRLVLRRGSANGLSTPSGATTVGTEFADSNFEGYDVFITDFTKAVTRRGVNGDFWNVNITLVQV